MPLEYAVAVKLIAPGACGGLGGLVGTGDGRRGTPQQASSLRATDNKSPTISFLQQTPIGRLSGQHATSKRGVLYALE